MRLSFSYLVYLILLPVFASAEPTCLGAQRSDLDSAPWSSIGMVISMDPSGAAAGTGFLISDRIIMTAAHVVMNPNANRTQWMTKNGPIVFLAGKSQIQLNLEDLSHVSDKISARILAYGNMDHKYPTLKAGDDWAILLLDRKPATSFTPLTLAPLGEFKVESLVTAGYPEACSNGSLAIFTVFEVPQIQRWPTFYYGAWPTLKVKTSEGHSGGPVLRRRDGSNGRVEWSVVGLVEGSPFDDSSVAYFVPSKEFISAAVGARGSNPTK